MAAREHRGTEFVGREAELAELVETLDSAASGSGHLVLIGGEPGVGKSRLAAELGTRARERGVDVLWGHAWEDAGAPAYWLWVQALRSHLRSTDADSIRRELGAGLGDVTQLLPELRQMFPDAPLPPAADSDSARFQLFDSTSTFIRNTALTRAVLIVLDDLQAADTPSLLLLRFWPPS